MWIRNIESTLRIRNLHRFLDIKVKRPPRDDFKEAVKWHNLSHEIQNYLSQNMSKSLRAQVTSHNVDVQYADVFVNEARRILQRTDSRTITNNIVSFVNTKYRDFTSAEQYLAAVRDKFIFMNQNEMILPPFLAIGLINTQLEPIFPTIINRMIDYMNSTSKNLLKTTDIVAALHYINTLIIEVEAASTTHMTTAALAIAPPVSNRNSGNSTRS